MFLRPPTCEGARLTLRRRLDVYLVRLETGLLRTRVRSRPVKLVVEPTNTCNLSCPVCFTGDGQVSRPRRARPLELYHRLLDEIGDSLMQIDLGNWGEPLLAKHLPEMIEAASRRGISTVMSTNFSIPFDAARRAARRLAAQRPRCGARRGRAGHVRTVPGRWQRRTGAEERPARPRREAPPRLDDAEDGLELPRLPAQRPGRRAGDGDGSRPGHRHRGREGL